MPVGEQELLTTGQAAKLCSVTPDTILKWIKKGRLTGVRTAGGHYRIERRVLEPLTVVPSHTEDDAVDLEESPAPTQHCWEYLSERGVVRDECRRCVVYRVRAARCFAMAGLEQDVGHARQFCQATCEDCVYYRRVQGLATNVLVISADDELSELLASEEDESVALRFAESGYEASAIIHDFRPAFAVVDAEQIAGGNTELLESLAGDRRVPGLRIILALPPGASSRRRRWLKNELIVGVLEKPFRVSQIAAVVRSAPAERHALGYRMSKLAKREDQR